MTAAVRRPSRARSNVLRRRRLTAAHRTWRWPPKYYASHIDDARGVQRFGHHSLCWLRWPHDQHNSWSTAVGALEMNLIVVINAAPPVAMSINVLVITLYTTAPAPRMFRRGWSLWGLCTDGRGRLCRAIFPAGGGCLSL